MSALNTGYNVAARSLFLSTLRPDAWLDAASAWAITAVTWGVAATEAHLGLWNGAYLAAAAVLATCTASSPVTSASSGGSVLLLLLLWLLSSSPVFLALTSFRHYGVYMGTYHLRGGVSYGRFLRDARLFKAVAWLQLLARVVPQIALPPTVGWDVPALLGVAGGLGVTALATARIGVERTYFGSELLGLGLERSL